jgi:hypothetical protein
METKMSKFEIAVQKGLMCTVGAIGVFAFGSTFFGAYWQIATGVCCTLLYLVMRHQLKKESDV